MIKEYCGECGKEKPKRKYEVLCDACGEVMLSQTLLPNHNLEESRKSERVRVQLGHQEFEVCITCITRVSSLFTTALAVSAQSQGRHEFVRELVVSARSRGHERIEELEKLL